MGVKGLQSFIENECTGACYEVSIKSLVDTYKAYSNRTPVIVVDCGSTIHPLYREFSWLNGGHLLELKARVEKLIKNFTDLGCELVMFQDGCVAPSKMGEWKERRNATAIDLSKTLHNLDLYGINYAEKNHNSAILPIGAYDIFCQSFYDNENCKVFTAIEECDREVAKYAMKHKCFAILGQDTDFVIFRAADYYLSSQHLDLDNMTTVCYDGNALARSLYIPLSDLPLFASLMGNDIVSVKLLKQFHNRLSSNSYTQRSYVHKAVKVRDYIISLRGSRNIHSIAKDVFGSRDMVSLLQESIGSYINLVGNGIEESPTDCSNDSNWETIKKFMRKEYIKTTGLDIFYELFFENRFLFGASLENYGAKQFMPVCKVTAL